MTSLVSYSKEKLWLEMLKEDLKIFSPDMIAMVEQYLPKTGLKTQLVATLKIMRVEVANSYDSNLYLRYKTIRLEFGKYIDERIQAMVSSNESSWIDPWLLLYKVMGDCEISTRLREASLHIHDILFTVCEVINHHLSHGNDLAVQEIQELKKNLLESYLGLFKQVTLQEDAQKLLDKLQKTLPEKLDELETNLNNKDFAKAKILLQEVEEEMRVSSVAFEILLKMKKSGSRECDHDFKTKDRSQS